MGEDQEVAAVFDILLEVVDFGRSEVILRGSHHEEVCLLDFFELD